MRTPVIMLDEVDKMGSDVRGAPTAALLEVLDTEENGTFVDHYVEVPLELSGVMFIATANSLAPIPDPLLDRMEVLVLPGYTPGEKLAIAQRYLLPRQLKETGLAAEHATVGDDALQRLIGEYTREAGVRNLEREIGGALREAAPGGGGRHFRARALTGPKLQPYSGPPPLLPPPAARPPGRGVGPRLASDPAGG